MKKIQRREFLKTSLAGVCGAAVAPAAWTSPLTGSGQKAAVPSLPGRALGKTGITTPLISMGTAEASSAEFIKMGYDSGIKLFFSATYYGQGNNERLVGEALKGLPRDSFVVGTAATPEGFNARAGTMPKEMTAQSYMKTAEDSLKRFGLDCVDILLLPFAAKREAIIFDPVMEAMTQLKKQGKIRFAGIATHNNFGEALRAAAESKFYDVAMTTYNYKVKDRAALADAVAYAVQAGMGVVAMKTTAGGGRAREGTQAVNTSTALKWALQNKNISTIVSGMSSVDELKKNLEMIKDLKLSEQELKDLGLAENHPQASLFCQQCQTCVPQCPNNLDIPALMRSYMYAYGYRNLGQARHTLDAVDLSGRGCASCGACSVACASGFDVKGRIQDILWLKSVPSEFIKA